MKHRVAIRFQGVDYLHGHRDEVAAVLETADEPSDAAAERALREFLAEGLEGIAQRVRAGWAAVRWLDDEQDAWRGPAWLFGVQAPTAGSFEVELTGQDDDDWPPPEVA